MQTVSPGIYTLERDFSVYAPELATSIFGIITTASKGPVNVATLVTDAGTLQAVFGPPGLLHQGLYAAQQYLKQGNQLWVVRVATYDQTAAPIEVRNGADAVDTLEFTALSSGSWANTVKVVVANAVVAGRYRILILDGNYTAEVYDNILIGAAHAADQNYVTTRIAGVSQYVTVAVLDDAQTTLKTGTQTFSGGLDGAPASTADIIGSVGSPPAVPPTGLQIFRNAEAIDLNLVAVPGSTSKNVIAELFDICTNRGDCMAILTTPYGLTVQQAVAWHNGLGGGPDDPDAALDSNYAALFYPWLQVYDSLAASDVWISPEGRVAGIMAYSDQVSAPWGAAAGLSRGLCPGVVDIEHSPTQGERDYMYGPGNNTNMFVKMASQGIVLWGQKTLQRAPTDLDRVNVRRLLLYLRKIIATAGRLLIFEPNDVRTV